MIHTVCLLTSSRQQTVNKKDNNASIIDVCKKKYEGIVSGQEQPL